MNYWLVKSEPFKYSWEQFVKDKVTFWDGVRNYQARNNLRAMKKGDKVLFYHSNEGLEIVGLAADIDAVGQIIGEYSVLIFIQSAVPGGDPYLAVGVLHQTGDVDLAAAGCHGGLQEAGAVVKVGAVIGADP